MWREARRTHSLLTTIIISKEISIKDFVKFGFGLSLNDSAVFAIYGTLFFRHPRIGQVLGGLRCFLRNYSDLGHCMTIKLILI